MRFEDEVTPATIIAELIRYVQASPDDTKGFIQLKHNADLCPRFYDRAERVLTSFDKYTSITYDIQGPRDRGTDVVIRYSSSAIEDDKQRYIALQIKSFDEFEKNKELVSKIKAQLYESKIDYGSQLDRYYLLLCTDHRKHLNRVRAICAELKNDKDVIVIEPRYAWSFYNMQETTIDAVADMLLYPEDYVRRKAKEQIQGVGKRRLFVLLSSMVHATEENDNYLISEDYIFDVYHNLDPLRFDTTSNEQISGDIGHLEGRFLYRDLEFGGFGIYPESVNAIIAMYYDATVRYHHRGDAAVNYLFSFLEQFASPA